MLLNLSSKFFYIASKISLIPTPYPYRPTEIWFSTFIEYWSEVSSLIWLIPSVIILFYRQKWTFCRFYTFLILKINLHCVIKVNSLWKHYEFPSFFVHQFLNLMLKMIKNEQKRSEGIAGSEMPEQITVLNTTLNILLVLSPVQSLQSFILLNQLDQVVS